MVFFMLKLKNKIISILLFTTILLQGEETSSQIWGNLIMGSAHNDKVYLELDFEPKLQVSPDQRWRNIDITSLLEYYPNKWMDITAEMVLGYTNDKSSIQSYEVSPRLGIRLHILGNLRQYIPNDNIFLFDRFSLSTLFRYEYRSLYYSDHGAEHQSRFRARIETKTALNHKNYTDDDTYYLFADVEQFFDFGNEIKEVFANKTRIRIGPGYTYDKIHRFEMLLLYDYARDTFEENIRHDAFIINFRYKVFY